MKNKKITMKPKTEQTTTEHDNDLDEVLVRRIVRETAETVPPVPENIFARIESAIESSSKPARRHGAPERTLMKDRIRQWLDLLFRPRVGWGLAAAQAVVLCLFLAFSPGGKQYNTLSMSQKDSPAGIHLYVMFDDQATVREIEQLLERMDGRIIDGPAGNGIYTIAFTPGTKSAPDKLVNRLKQSKIITFAERIY